MTYLYWLPVVRLSSVHLSVFSSHYYLLHNHLANFKQTGTKHLWVKGIKVYSIKEPHSFRSDVWGGGGGINAWGVVITKNSIKELKFFFSRPLKRFEPNLTKSNLLGDGAQNFTNKAHSILKRKNHILCENVFRDWNRFSGERCDPWAFCSGSFSSETDQMKYKYYWYIKNYVYTLLYDNCWGNFDQMTVRKLWLEVIACLFVFKVFFPINNFSFI